MRERIGARWCSRAMSGSDIPSRQALRLCSQSFDLYVSLHSTSACALNLQNPLHASVYHRLSIIDTAVRCLIRLKWKGLLINLEDGDMAQIASRMVYESQRWPSRQRPQYHRERPCKMIPHRPRLFPHHLKSTGVGLSIQVTHVLTFFAGRFSYLARKYI